MQPGVIVTILNNLYMHITCNISAVHQNRNIFQSLCIANHGLLMKDVIDVIFNWWLKGYHKYNYETAHVSKNFILVRMFAICTTGKTIILFMQKSSTSQNWNKNSVLSWLLTVIYL